MMSVRHSGPFTIGPSWSPTENLGHKPRTVILLASLGRVTVVDPLEVFVVVVRPVPATGIFPAPADFSRSACQKSRNR